MELSRDFMLARFMARDASMDGRFLSGVRTTGIYCLPSCPARKPRPENVRFYASEAEARAAGLRPCRRCRPDRLHAAGDPQPGHLPPLAIPGRRALMLLADVLPTPVGDLLALVRGDGALVALHFLDGADPGAAARRHAGGEEVRRGGAAATGHVAEQMAEYFQGRRRAFDLALAPTGTEFQRRVWRELCAIPYGETLGYAELARRIGRPGAARAVGRANGTNPLPIVVPCHRVIGANGDLTGYGGGLGRKRFLLRLEGALPGALQLGADRP